MSAEVGTGGAAVAVSWAAEDRPCPLCDSRRHRRVGRRGGEAHRAGHGVVATVVRCRDCGAFYTSPTLLPRGNPYAAETAAEYFRIHDAEGKRGAGRELARKAERLLGRKGAMIEVGCGRGELLEGARDEGWQVSGIEM